MGKREPLTKTATIPLMVNSPLITKILKERGCGWYS